MNAIFVALTLLDALLLWVLASQRKGWWSLKAIAIIAVLSLNFLTFNAWDSGNGWPVKGLPKEALFLGCDPVEPSGSNPGAIYLFGVPLKRQKNTIGYSSPSQAPRTYMLPYSRKLELSCSSTSKLAGHGIPMLFGKKKVSGVKGSGLQRRNKYANPFYHLPPNLTPQKPGGK